MMTFNQAEFDIRCEWGEHGVRTLAPISDVLIIVDVLSFSTSVDIAVSRGAFIYPFAQKDETAQAYAAKVGAQLAGHWRSQAGYTLSPASLVDIPAGARLVLPSLNGSTLTLAAKPTPVLAGCLRNARAVAAAASRLGRRVAVIPAGERWQDDWTLRPSFEDLIGAGAVISHLAGSLSPDAQMAAAAFRAAQPRLSDHLKLCGSGKELIELGFENDVILASQLDASACAPLLVNDAYTRMEG